MEYVISKIVNNLKGKFRKVDVEKVQQAIIEANGIMGQLAKDILNG